MKQLLTHPGRKRGALGVKALRGLLVSLAAALVLWACLPPDPWNLEGTSAQPGTIRTLEIPVGDLLFNARIAGSGSGEFVLLLHGFPQTSYEWRHQLRALGEAGYRAVAPDQRGYSPLARPAEVAEYTLLHLAADVVSMADALGATKFHLVGHDWGAVVAWVVAQLVPERLISLTALSIPHPDALVAAMGGEGSCQSSASSYILDFTSPQVVDVALADDMAVLRSVFGGVRDVAVEEYLRVVGNREALTAALNWYRANLAWPAIPGLELGPIRVPTLYVWSDKDGTVCRDAALLTKRYVTAPYRFEVLRGVNHWIADTASDRLNPLVLNHIRANRGR